MSCIFFLQGAPIVDTVLGEDNGSYVVIDEGVNDTISFSIDDDEYEVTLTPGSYLLPTSNIFGYEKRLTDMLDRCFDDAGIPAVTRFVMYNSIELSGAGVRIEFGESASGEHKIEISDPEEAVFVLSKFTGDLINTLLGRVFCNVSGWEPENIEEIDGRDIRLVSKDEPVEPVVDDTLSDDIEDNGEEIIWG